MQPVLSVCIPTRNRAAYLERCLTELLRIHDLPFPVEIVVSDNASEDETAEVCARFIDRLPLTVHVQREDVGAENNVVSALRAATGRYAVYLGDDDRLDWRAMQQVVGLFEENAGLVCVQAPWRTRDDAKGQDHGLFYVVPDPAAFTAEQAWPCWQFLLRNRIFPEIAVYRTADLHAILHLPTTVHWAFVWCFRLLGRGTVAFLPVPFYIHVVRPSPDLPPRTQVGVSQSMTHLDRYRGGLEWGLAAALRRVAGHVPQEHRQQAMLLLNRFQAERAEVAARVAAGQADFIGAIEHFSRAHVWDAGVDREAIQRFEQEHSMLASLQALVRTAEASAGCARVVLDRVDNSERVQAIIAQVFAFPCDIRGEDPLDPSDVVLVMSGTKRVAAVEAGALPGRVLAWDELVDCFRVHDVLGAIRRTQQTTDSAA